MLLLEQARRGNREGRTEPYQGVEGWGEMAVFDAIYCLAVDASQLSKACLTEVVFCTQGQKSVCKFIPHVLHITLE